MRTVRRDDVPVSPSGSLPVASRHRVEPVPAGSDAMVQADTSS